MKFRIITILIITLLCVEKAKSQFTQDMFDEITEFVETERKAYSIPNVVVGITNSEGTIYLNNFGNGEIDDLYLIGSNSKSFTALGILILQQKGLLDINNPVKNYLSWFKYEKPGQSDRVTVKDLLNQTSGIPKKLGMSKPGSIEEFQQLLKQISPQNGSIGKFEYSNLNYQLLGLIIEKVSKRKYAEFLKEEVLSPLNMSKTFATYNETVQNGLIPSYQYLLYYPFLPKSINFQNYEVPSGFISTTTEDMGHYLRSLINSKNSMQNSIFDQNITDQLFKPGTEKNFSYGMGWYVIRNWKGYEMYIHGGQTQSFSSSMQIIPKLGVGIIIMSNINNESTVNNMAFAISRILAEKERTEYSKTNFYLMQSIPFIALLILLVLFFRLKRWIKLKFPIGINKRVLPNIWLLSGLGFGLFWVIYFPIAFSTPLMAIVDYEPSSGYSIIMVTIGIILNSILAYFNKTRKNLS
ncbi:serine hydrolase domain-containing protein [Xanthovirga aplysinae]|uniref:serine hydrolase domain-containing protein n=1 Tax=Xanthovirga aplysinae TaxID=2529853 RepID=UPI0012BCF5FC|nr:serine hydrolase domain-containing protein [Xanthovirga aplysinae]MTI33164.1 hypothetical protein [Xanthovirga aplysinae]